MNKEAPKLLSRPNCANCEAACCQNIILPLNDDEVSILKTAGTVLKFVGRPDTGRDVRGYYKMEGKCGHLEKDPATGMLKCGIHGTDQPLVCSGGFPEGGYGCMERRTAFFKEQRGE
ncbi:YkgJ family cysteine cluster protein [Patescibacteria group bacterium]|nr:YkgJ family cysteine cluster protein [Patescibacteria group bacterium]